MADTISVLSLQIGIFAFLALKCCALYVAMRRESSLGWLTGALIFAALLAIALELLPTSRLEVAAAIICMPSAIFCLGQAVRLVTNGTRLHGQFWLGIAAASIATTVLLFTGTPYLYVAILLKLTLAAATLEPVVRLVRTQQRHVLDWPLMALISGVAALFVARIPVWLEAFTSVTPYSEFLRARFESQMLLSAGLIASLIVLLLLARGLSQLVMELRYRTARDPATSLYNRDAFREQVALARGRVGALVFCDIDKFKRVNDRYGHAVGDKAILAFARALGGTGAIAGRMGGDEFALFLPGMEAKEAEPIVEMVRCEFACVKVETVGSPPLTASFGVATHFRGSDLGIALKHADRALYYAKNAGRNRVVVFDDSEEAMETSSGRRAAIA